MIRRALTLVTVLVCTAAQIPTFAAVRPDSLKCEYRIDPLGIDTMKPRLSWILVSQERAQKQSAYRILVASSPEQLRKRAGDLWDTAKVTSGESIQIEYAGKPLHPNEECWWG